MDAALQANFDGIQLVRSFTDARKRWRRAFATLWSTRALHSLAKEIVAKKQGTFLPKLLHSPSYVVVNVKPDRFSGLSRSSLRELVEAKNIEQLVQFGGVEGVVSALETNAEKGIPGDNEDIASRHKAFGSNTYQKLPTKTLQIVLDAFRDPIILILLMCGMLSLVFGIKKHGLKGCSDGGSIFIAVFLVTTISALSNFWPSRHFNKLSEASGNIPVLVIRNAQEKKIPKFDVVVGDVVCLRVGDQVPANGLFIEGYSLQVDESSMRSESDPVEVSCSHNPFLVSGTEVADGYAHMLVTSVGMNTAWGQMMSSISCNSNKKTPLQAKLKRLTLYITKVGLVVAILVVAVLSVHYFTGDMSDDNGSRLFTGGKTSIHDVFDAVVGILATPIAIASSAIPEGLLLAVTITLAYSTKKMADDQALVRNLPACEALRSTTVICTNKKGILTLNHMEVSKFWLGQEYDKVGALIAPGVLELLHQGVGLNRDEVPSGSCVELSENQAENAIYNWGVQDLGINIEQLKKSCMILHVEASNSETKQRGILIKKKASNTIHVHQKGEPEVILAMCSHYCQHTGSIEVVNNGTRAKLEQIIQDMASDGLQCMAFAHKEIQPNFEKEGLTLIGLVGLKDPCRPQVRKAVMDCQHARVNIKMITEDNISTARASAIECGIIEPNQEITTGEVVEGAEFRNYTPQERKEKVDKIRVMARASTLDKLLMVRCLKERGHVVAVTGSNVGDARALMEADIGISLGKQGTDIARENSDIVILDDNFISVARVLWWGRGMYNNIQVFTQFQLTVSIASLVIDFVTAISTGEPPTINIVATISTGKVPYATLQVLWVKLVVGTLAALALTIQKPTNELMQQPPVDWDEPLITNIMWRNIVAQALYQIAIILTIQFKGKKIFCVDAKVNDTLIFNTFVLCQLFIIFNRWKFDKNVFKGLQRKKLFWGIVGTIVLLQIVMVELLKRFADTERLDWWQWVACITIAIVSWLIGWLVKFIPVPQKPFFSYFMRQNLNYRRI